MFICHLYIYVVDKPWKYNIQKYFIEVKNDRYRTVIYVEKYYGT